MTDTADSFWNFSLDVYTRPGVSQACIVLQDNYGCDVNLLLFSCWCAATRGPLTDEQLTASIQRVGVWQTEIIQRLRNVRRLLEQNFAHVDKSISGDLRSRVGVNELSAEQVEQNLLQDIVGEWPGAEASNEPPAELARQNIAAYTRLIEVDADADAQDAVNIIIDGCFGER